jgi:predicted acylesterase/phospholipase RssA
MSTPKNTLQIGLCMAGAISAGAYTAGVVDYLIEALDEWYKRKSDGQPNVPAHNIEISVIGGASAGGMTSIITAAALQNIIGMVGPANKNTSRPKPNNVFYHSWVDLTHEDMFSEILKSSDIKKNTVPSILNSNFIDEVAERALSINHNPQHRPYIASELKVFVSLTNLQGMEFGLDFDSISKKNQFIVTNHKDYACLKFCKNEKNEINDGWIPVNLKTGHHLPLAKAAAMATGAFPLGLRARRVVRDAEYLNNNPWFDYITKVANKPFNDVYDSYFIDGGMINNEPFEKVKIVLDDILHSKNEEMNEADIAGFKSTIIMIDPFPSEVSGEIAGSSIEPNSKEMDFDLPTIASKTLSALKNQSRIKPIDLKDALDPNQMGQFLIAPVRYVKDINSDTDISIEGKRAIACGSLGGFGGFLKKDFRIHDFYLGRANCEKFLRDYFIVPIDSRSDIIEQGYVGLSKSERDKFTSFDKNGNRRGLQIIPIFSQQANQPDMPIFANGRTWPSITEREIKRYKSPIKRRIKAIISILSGTKALKKTFLIIYASPLIAFITNKIMRFIIDSATNRNV